MFEELFCRPSIVRKHLDGPLVEARRRHLEDLAATGHTRGTQLRHAAYALCVAVALDVWPRLGVATPIEPAEIEALATAWARSRLKRRARAVRLPRRSFLQLARTLLTRLDRLARPRADPIVERVEQFVLAHQERWPSPYTRRSVAVHVVGFLRFVEARGIASELASFDEIDAFLRDRRSRCKQGSIRCAVYALRAWFEFAPSRGWARAGLADGIWHPRSYAHAGLLPGPTPQQVRVTIAAIAAIAGDGAVALRDRAIFLLLATYGLRAVEVCALRLRDLDWARKRLHVVRAKAGRSHWVPLESAVGAAIARYLHEARPIATSDAVFLTVHAPFRALSTAGLYNIVAHHLVAHADVAQGRGPHGLRHASARALLSSGATLKTIGDHLGHRSADATAIYAKVDERSLRDVAWTDVEGLA